MTLQEALSEGRTALQQAGIPEADLDAWYLLEYVTGIDRAHYLAEPGKKIEKEELEKYRACIVRRTGHIPLQHITGEQEFMGLSFLVNRHVLIPRQDTEILTEEALKMLETGNIPVQDGKIRILDLCTGSGCILLSILYWAAKDSRLSDMTGIGADISEEALKVAGENGRRLKIENAGFICSDLFDRISGTFGMIVSNPPYIRTEEIKSLQEEVRLHDPLLALDGKEDGLFFYRRIIGSAERFLEKGGALLFEIGCDQAEDVKKLMESAGFCNVSVVKDLAGLDRVVRGIRAL